MSAKAGVSQPASRSRIEEMGDQAEVLESPPCIAEYLVRHFFDVGPVLYGAMGAAPLSHVELLAWQANTGVVLNAWESLALRRMSNAYLSMVDKAKSPLCPSPWLNLQRDEQDVEATAGHIRNLLRG